MAMRAIVVAHALLFSSWMVLFLVQTSLVATHHVRVHRRLGIAGAVIATVMVVSAPPTAIGRWPWIVRHPAPGVLGILSLFLVAPVVGDLLARRRPHPISVFGGLALLISVPLRFAVGQTAVWHELARWIVG